LHPSRPTPHLPPRPPPHTPPPPPPRPPPPPAPHFPPHAPSTFLPTSIHLGDGNPRDRRVLADLGRERSLAEAAHPCVRTHPGRPPRTVATHPREKITTFLHLSDLGKRESLYTDGAKLWNKWREVEYCGCYRSRWVSKG